MIRELHHSLLLLWILLGMTQVHEDHGSRTFGHYRRGRPLLWRVAPGRIRLAFVWRIWQSFAASSFAATEMRKIRKLMAHTLTLWDFYRFSLIRPLYSCFTHSNTFCFTSQVTLIKQMYPRVIMSHFPSFYFFSIVGHLCSPFFKRSYIHYSTN